VSVQSSFSPELIYFRCFFNSPNVGTPFLPSCDSLPPLTEVLPLSFLRAMWCRLSCFPHFFFFSGRSPVHCGILRRCPFREAFVVSIPSIASPEERLSPIVMEFQEQRLIFSSLPSFPPMTLLGSPLSSCGWMFFNDGRKRG